MLSVKTEAIVSVCETEHSPLWTNVLPKNLSMSNFIKKEYINKRSQDLPKYYRINGALFIAKIEYLNRMNGFFGNKTKAYIMPRNRSVDIDTETDFEVCKIMLNKRSVK